MNTSNWILKAPAMSKAQDRMDKIHVLLVDHDSNAHAPLVEMFEYFSYKVTSVGLASSAVSILSNGKEKFDLLVENIRSPDACGYKLLHIALQMNMPVILLLDEDDFLLTMRALATGVLLCITKPVPVEIAEYLWQLVAGEKIRKEKIMGQFRELTIPRRLQNGVRGEDLVEGFSSGNTSLDESHKSMKKMKYSEIANQEHNIITCKRKFWIEWTQELHDRFVYAIRTLGEGRCYPKDILELMNVPGLTRMQVASHLQKCRRGTWLHPTERKLNITAAPVRIPGNTSNPAKSKRFGSMPRLKLNPQLHLNAQENDENYHYEVPMMNSSIGENVLGSDSEEGLSEVYNPFSDVGVESTNMERVTQDFDIDDDVFMPEQKFVIDIQSVTPTANTSPFVIDTQSVTPTANTSPDDQSITTEEFFEFPNVDIMIQNFYGLEQVEVDDALDLDQVYSYNKNEVPVVLGTGKVKTEVCGEN